MSKNFFHQCGIAENYGFEPKIFLNLNPECSAIELFLQIFKIISYRCKKVVENNGFEPLTPCVQGRCSSQLS